jgi:hypothetical protein
LREQGRFADALATLRRGHELGSKTPGWRYPSAAWVARCARLAELDQKLPAVRDGKDQPASPAEALELAALCRHPARRLHATSARLAAGAFSAQPKLADNLKDQPRYHAACSASLAAAGLADDAKRLTEEERAALRRQALAWLRADLALYAKMAKSDNPRARAAVRQRLEHWRQDADLAPVRDKAALAKLPEAEREDWQKLWADVAALLKRAEAK